MSSSARNVAPSVALRRHIQSITASSYDVWGLQCGQGQQSETQARIESSPSWICAGLRHGRVGEPDPLRLRSGWLACFSWRLWIAREGRPAIRGSAAMHRRVVHVRGDHADSRNGSRSQRDVLAPSSGGADTARRRHKRKRESRVPFDKEECIREFLAAQASGCAHATLHALSRLARPGGFDWVNTNLTEIGLRSEAPLEFAVGLAEACAARLADISASCAARLADTSGSQSSAAADERNRLAWMSRPVSALLVNVCDVHFDSLPVVRQDEIRRRIHPLSDFILPVPWSLLVNQLALAVPQGLLLQQARDMLQQSTRLIDALQFVSNLRLFPLMTFDELIRPMVDARQSKLALQAAQAYPPFLPATIRAIVHIHPTAAFRAVVENSLDVAAFADIEYAAKRPTLRWLAKEGKLHEFAIGVCGDNRRLQEYALTLLSQAGQMQAFREAYEAFQGGISSQSLRNLYYKYISSPHLFPEPAKAVPNPNEFLQMSVPILFEPEDDVFVSHFLSSDVVGIDVEFVPSFTSIEGRTNRAATLQLSTPSLCVIFDMCIPLSPRRATFLRELFRAEPVLKLGFSLKGDLQALMESHRETDVFSSVGPMIDLQSAVRSLAIDGLPETNHVSLSKLCELLLGKPLDKTEQLSNWARRPLRPEQMNYAGLDAHVLTDLYEVIRRQPLANVEVCLTV